MDDGCPAAAREVDDGCPAAASYIVCIVCKECEKDLAEVIPALEKAILALDALEARDIAEIKCYHNPPELIKQVCRLLQLTVVHD